MDHDQFIKNVKSWPKKAGKAAFLKFLNGERLTRAEEIEAMCYSCVQGENTQPCTSKTCPLVGSCQWNKK